MQAHLRRHHPDIDISSTRKRPQKQETLSTAFKIKLQADSDRAQAITKAIGVFMALDIAHFQLLRTHGFTHLLRVLEPRYQLPSRPHFSQNVLPQLYNKVKAKLVEDLSNAKFIALTTDGWTSRATQSFITITTHYITDNWVIANPVLQTRAVYESHTSDHLSEILQGAVAEWKIDRENATVPVTTDNAKNIVNAVNAAGFSPNIRCFAHTVNLASQRGMSVNQMSRLLGRVRKVVTFFHRSTTAAAVLKDKQEMLQLPTHKLIQDVPTRWNSSYDMLERYLEQQAAVFSALTDKNAKRNIKDILTLSDEDVKVAEDIVQVLKPLKTVTALLSTEQLPTVSMIMPLKHTILESMNVSCTDTAVVKDVKSAIVSDFTNRYPDSDSTLAQFLHMSTALDPRFKSLPFLDENTRRIVFNSLIEKILEYHPSQAQASKEQSEVASSSECDPPAKRAPITELFGKLFPVETSTPASKSLSQMVKEEVQRYKEVPTLQVESNPLAWWKDKESQFPHLARLAKSFLGVPATSVPSERVFSTAGDIVTAQRASLSPENVDMMSAKVSTKHKLKIEVSVSELDAQ
ncbi:E3 SUMO-protein ligase ZBED1-like [Xyrauchen texanus]|uniref:E3 SUMO-protein ligase ZBED1-like n=1 Tax=Xyrauchen texanus TaxID=154827 RepID=UPI0022426947|nr:E3 SUMO-protein ligase ZBED1-like [Xyrauchen texanus]